MELVKLFLSTKSWEIVVAIVGGYLAAKGLDGLTRTEFLIYLFVAMIIGFAASDFFVPLAIEYKYLSIEAGKNVKPLAIIVMSAGSLKLMDIIYGWIAKLKDLKFKFKIGK
jgi:hypothetical protein